MHYAQQSVSRILRGTVLCNDGTYKCGNGVFPTCAPGVKFGGTCDFDAGWQTCVLCQGSMSYQLSCQPAADVGWGGTVISCSN